VQPDQYCHLVAVRVNTDMLDAIDAEVHRLRRIRPGAHIQRSDALRELLHRALFATEESSTKDAAIPESTAP
jgi:hypothetical protein